MSRTNSLLLLCLAVPFVGCKDSPTWRGWGAGSANRFQAQSDAATGVVRWTSDARDNLGPSIGCPILWADRGASSWTDSRIFVGSAAGINERLPLNNNSVSDFQVPDGVVGCPAVPYDLLFIATSAGHIIALVPASAPLAKAWETDLKMGSVLPTSPISDGTNVYIAAETRVFALRSTDGSVAWQRSLSGAVSPIAALTLSISDPPRVVLATLNGHVQAFDPGSGASIWDQEFPGEAFNQGVAAGVSGNLYVVGFHGHAYGLSAQDGHQLWSYSTPANLPLRGPAVAFRDNRDWVYFVDNTPTLYVLDQTGGLYRSQSLPDIPQSNPVVGLNDRVYLAVGAAPTARVISLGPTGELWSVATGGPARYLAVGMNGDVYATSGLGTLTAIR